MGYLFIFFDLGEERDIIFIKKKGIYLENCNFGCIFLSYYIVVEFCDYYKFLRVLYINISYFYFILDNLGDCCFVSFFMVC